MRSPRNPGRFSGGRLQEANGCLRVVRVGEPHEVVERDETRVVVPVLEAQGLADGIEQEGLSRAAAADEQQRVAAGQGCENDEFLRLEPIGAEGGQATA
jgi:hypothetical protein